MPLNRETGNLFHLFHSLKYFVKVRLNRKKRKLFISKETFCRPQIEAEEEEFFIRSIFFYKKSSKIFS
jgi:hypothetical protein